MSLSLLSWRALRLGEKKDARESRSAGIGIANNALPSDVGRLVSAANQPARRLRAIHTQCVKALAKIAKNAERENE